MAAPVAVADGSVIVTLGLGDLVARQHLRRDEQRMQVDELKQAIADNGGDRLERLAAEIKKKENLRDTRQVKARRYGELTAKLDEPPASGNIVVASA